MLKNEYHKNTLCRFHTLKMADYCKQKYKIHSEIERSCIKVYTISP